MIVFDSLTDSSIKALSPKSVKRASNLSVNYLKSFLDFTTEGKLVSTMLLTTENNTLKYQTILFNSKSEMVNHLDNNRDVIKRYEHIVPLESFVPITSLEETISIYKPYMKTIVNIVNPLITSTETQVSTNPME